MISKLNCSTVLLLAVFLASALKVDGAPITQTTILNAGFEGQGSDLGDGLRSADNWQNPSLFAARAFAGRDGINTGSSGYLRVIADENNSGSAWQDITGSTNAGLSYTFGATAFHTPNAQAGLADYEVTLSLLEVGRGTTVGGPTIDHAQPILIDINSVMITQLGDTASLSVTFGDDGSDVDVELRIQLSAPDPLPSGTFTRGGVDDIVLTTTAVPEPCSAILLGSFGLAAAARRRRKAT